MKGTVNELSDLIDRYKNINGKEVWYARQPRDYVEKKEPKPVTAIKNNYWFGK